MERLTGLDASFLYLETPTQHMHVAMTAVLDPSEMPGGYAFEKIQALIASKVHELPPFRRRLVEIPFHLHHPLWVNDPDFDIIHHVRSVQCPAPGGAKELAEICGRINSSPLDRSRPLWEMWVIEGLEDGRFAMLCKVHHSAVDGSTGAGLLVHLFSMSRETPEPPPPHPVEAEEIPSDVDLIAYAAASRMKQPAELLKLARETFHAVGDVVNRRREHTHAEGATPLAAPPTPFNHPIGPRRAVAFSRLSLEGLKEVKNICGVKLNDVVLAVCAGALRCYLDGRDELPTLPLTAVVPISVASDPNARGTNKVSTLFTSLATNIDDPVARLMTIRRSTQGAKEEHKAIGATLLQSWAEFAAPQTFHMAARAYTHLKLADKHRPVGNLVVSNVPGPPFPIYLAGAELVAAYPMGPVMEGFGLNITVMSYRGTIDFGFMAAADLVPDVDALASCIEPAFEALLQEARSLKETPPAAKKKPPARRPRARARR